MNAWVLTYGMPALLGLSAGIVGSLIAPWANWGVEKRRARQARRSELINSCRMLLSTDIDKKRFRETELYSRIRPHLYKRVIEELEEKRDESIEDEASVHRFKQKLLEEIARIEKEWVLI
ncbi:MAG: hypothetical protein C4530_05275 [Desulfobacteraceae bacterium]|nr:MAG: hypothetical protein C4530_05275 [Desulfobacteraceae bacterium]